MSRVADWAGGDEKLEGIFENKLKNCSNFQKFKQKQKL